MRDSSLLTEDVRARIGSTGPAAAVAITPRAVERTMDVYLGHHRRAFEPGDIVPGYVLVALQAEVDNIGFPDLLPNSVLVSNEFSLERPLRLGEELTVQSRLADVSERLGGRFGYGLYVRTETEYRDPAGGVIARMSQTLMYYDAADAREEGEQ